MGRTLHSVVRFAGKLMRDFDEIITFEVFCDFPLGIYGMVRPPLGELAHENLPKKMKGCVAGVPWPPSSSIIRRWLPYSIKVLVKTNQTSPNSMGLRRLITEFLWPPSSSIIRRCYHIVSKYCQDESNEPKLDGVASFNYGVPWPPSSSIIRR
ncbi:hypothetical protein EVAR_92195_1 [Eumeta japonica]|uniref:Uncharacterized protein n=1 Tax=Eumeta variegata TaxID=151549 RepID=A0A4C1TMB5_EUMVA|nr:hypothetical protein EVAR_92195_1 [Eumeta japonica]